MVCMYLIYEVADVPRCLEVPGCPWTLALYPLLKGPGYEASVRLAWVSQVCVFPRNVEVPFYSFMSWVSQVCEGYLVSVMSWVSSRHQGS